MGGRVKCRVRGVRGERLPRFLKRCLRKLIGKVLRTRSLPHTLVLVVKKRRSPRSRPPQDAEVVVQISPLDKCPLEPQVRRASQLQAPCSSSEEPPDFQQIALAMFDKVLLGACLGSEDALISSSRNCQPSEGGADDPASLNKCN